MSRRENGALAAAEALDQAMAGVNQAEAVLLFATSYYTDPRPILAVAHEAAGNAPVVGCAASGVLSDQGEIEDGPGVVAVALSQDAGITSAAPFWCSALGEIVRAAPVGRAPAVSLLFPDAHSMHPEVLADQVQSDLSLTTPIVGGLAAGPPGKNLAYRWIGDELAAHGAAGVVLCTQNEPLVGVAQACVPVGHAHTVTACDNNIIATLDDRPAFEQFAQHAKPLLADLATAAQTIFLAVPGGPHEADDPVDDGYVTRGFLQFDPDRGLLALSEAVPVGSRVRFALRNPIAARQRIRQMTDDLKTRLLGRTPKLGLYFNCAGRGEDFFGVPDHDVAFIQATLGQFPLIGIFGAGELSPVRKRTRLQLFSGVLVLLT